MTFEAGGISVEIPHVIDVITESGNLGQIGFGSPKYGATVLVRVSRYTGPEKMAKGVLQCEDAEWKHTLTGAELKKVEDINVGVLQLTFEAESEDGINSPLIHGPSGR